MTILYSNITNGFYDQAAHIDSGMTWPSDLILVTVAERDFIDAALASGKKVEYVAGAWISMDHTPGKIAESDRILKTKIAAIEVNQGRALREIALGIEGGTKRLIEIESAIAALREQLSAI